MDDKLNLLITFSFYNSCKELKIKCNDKIKLKKLSLNRQIIAKLHNSQMQGVRGGAKFSCQKQSCRGTCAGDSCCEQ